MTNEMFRPTNAHDALVRLSEECHELGKVACKALRFGAYDRHPTRKKMNIELLLEEFTDVAEAINDFLRLNRDCEYPPFESAEEKHVSELLKKAQKTVAPIIARERKVVSNDIEDGSANGN